MVDHVKAQNPFKRKVIHVFVSLCDNEHQGIVPVPAKLGNGLDPDNNLYWGAAYGVKSFFKNKSDNWNLVKTIKDPSKYILERVIFKNETSGTLLIADAYDGAYIKQTVMDFLNSCGGLKNEVVELSGEKIGIAGDADLLAYTGHNGLMDFDLEGDIDISKFKETSRDVIILACFSKSYFSTYLKACKANPLVWSTGLMSPEAYTLKWALDGWMENEDNGRVVQRAREAYNHYQHCGIRGASNLLVSGF